MGGFDGASCEGDWKCTGVNMAGKYQFITDENGENYLVVKGTAQWRGKKRDKDEGFGVMMAMNTADK